MNKSSPVSLAPLAALLIAGSVLAQTIPSPNASGVDADRIDRRCTSTTLSTDATAPCSDDVRNDGPRVSPLVVRPPGSGNTSAGFTGTSMGTTGMPSTGTVNSGTSSMPGATAPGAVSASGAVRRPAAR
jgi:hypothetical protein